MVTLSPTYLANRRDGHNKFYICVHIDDEGRLPHATRSLIGFGAIGGGGQWRVVPRAEGKRKINEKIGGRGYAQIVINPHVMVGSAAINRMLEELESMLSKTVVFHPSDGRLSVDDPAAAVHDLSASTAQPAEHPDWAGDW